MCPACDFPTAISELQVVCPFLPAQLRRSFETFGP
jgi:hypothetical protein